MNTESWVSSLMFLITWTTMIRIYNFKKTWITQLFLQSSTWRFKDYITIKGNDGHIHRLNSDYEFNYIINRMVPIISKCNPSKKIK